MDERPDEDSLRGLIGEMCAARPSQIGVIAFKLRDTWGTDLAAALIPEFRAIPKAMVRASLLMTVGPFARDSKDAVTLGLNALADRSKIVRHQACALLAYSQSVDALPEMRARLDSIPDVSRDDLVYAIAAIEEDNHNLFRDRGRTGRIRWGY